MTENEEEIFELNNVDPEDISNVLMKVENSFQIKFGDTELKDVKTFGELCDIIINKIQQQNSSDCTTQQAFYKLRNAISTTTLIEKNEIVPTTGLHVLFPRKNRRQTVRLVEKELGFSLKAMRAKNVFLILFPILLLVSLLCLFASWQFGLIGITVALIGAIITNKFGKELNLNDVGELAEKVSRENYFDSRRNNKTVNRMEVVQMS